MFRLVPLAAVSLAMLTLPAFADASSDAIAFWFAITASW